MHRKIALVGRDEKSVRGQYDVERELGDRLRAARPEDRRSLYSEIYNELFTRVPDHPQHKRKADPASQQAAVNRQFRLLRHFLNPNVVYLEVGAGDCHLALAVAPRVRHAYAVDVSDIISARRQTPANFSLVITDGIKIDVPRGSVDVAYSNQLLEHLHPDDAAEQIREVHHALAPSGCYIAVTPHRYSGPHDVSRLFDHEARGVHLKEYTYRELRSMFLSAGFSSTSRWMGIRGHFFRLPDPIILALESIFAALPRLLRTRLARSRLLRPLFGDTIIVAAKSAS
ncbi:MAG: class I SAM-dependent methyltransferase [Bacillota bacterium]